jgi:AcrR family transcriptional regulator
VRAAEQVFARQGVEEANLRDINRLAGQANNSALHYHFGSRAALAEVVIERHRAVVTAARAQFVAELDGRESQPTLAELVSAIVAPLADRLGCASGRDYLRILVHIRHRGEIREHGPLSDALSPDLSWVYRHLNDALGALSPALRSERVAAVGDMILAALAARAAMHPDVGQLDDAAFAANLVDMSVAALEAPIGSASR